MPNRSSSSRCAALRQACTAVAALTLCSASALLILTAPLAAEDPKEAIELHCGRLLDVETRQALSNQKILIIDGEISAIGRNVPAPRTATRIDLSDSTCMPGLMDMHAHLFIDVTGKTVDQSAPSQSSAYNALMGLRNAQTLLQLGYTTIRVPGDMDYHFAGIELRNAIERGWYQGPRMLVAPHAISPLGGHGDFNSYAPDLPHPVLGPVIADGVDEVRRAVRREIKYGADWIKIMASGGVMSQHDDPEVAAYTAEEFQAFADETHRHGKKITAHAHGDAGIRGAVLAGFDSIEHGTMMTAETAQLMAERGTFYVPTVYVVDWILEQGASGGISANNLAKAELVSGKHADSIRHASSAGVKFIIGSDPIYPMDEAIREFTALAKRVRDNWAVLQAGTINAAHMLGLEDQIGSISVGKQADIVATPGNPIDRMQEIERVSFVMKGGQVVHNE